MRARSFAALAAMAALAGGATADTGTFQPVADATIYSNESALLANGKGTGLFCGKNAQANTRRGLLRFDLSSIPAGSTITGASLTLHLNSSTPAVGDVSLRRATRAWSEGPATPIGVGGNGVAPAAGDSTWLHTSYSTQFWTTEGGDFAAGDSAVLTIADEIDFYTWSSATMVSDVQGWVADAATNHGWFLLGNEAVITTAKRFESREAIDPALRPSLVVTYTPPVACYANCDGSTSAPVLNVLDFNCFLNRFSQGSSYANCDNSTSEPVLNVLDFNCFLNRFSQGCP